MKSCAFCAFKSGEETAFAEHVATVHAWRQAQRSSSEDKLIIAGIAGGVVAAFFVTLPVVALLTPPGKESDLDYGLLGAAMWLGSAVGLAGIARREGSPRAALGRCLVVGGTLGGAAVIALRSRWPDEDVYHYLVLAVVMLILGFILRAPAIPTTVRRKGPRTSRQSR